MRSIRVARRATTAEPMNPATVAASRMPSRSRSSPAQRSRREALAASSFTARCAEINQREAVAICLVSIIGQIRIGFLWFRTQTPCAAPDRSDCASRRRGSREGQRLDRLVVNKAHCQHAIGGEFSIGRGARLVTRVVERPLPRNGRQERGACNGDDPV